MTHFEEIQKTPCASVNQVTATSVGPAGTYYAPATSMGRRTPLHVVTPILAFDRAQWTF